MKPVRIIVLGVAALAAVGLALLVRGMVAGKPTSQANAAAPIAQPANKPMARVLVAKRDLKIGDRLTAQDLDWQEWPVDAVNAAYVTDGSVAPPPPPAAPAKGKPAGSAATATATVQATRAIEELSGAGPTANFVGSVVREPFLAGEPIVERKLVHAGDSGYLAVVLQPGMRAMSVAVTVETGAGGFILPGDRVDVILAAEVSSDQTEGASRKAWSSGTVLRNIKVLAIDQATKPENGATTVVGATATLEVGPQEAEALALAKSLGDLSLTLRSYADAQQPSGLGEDVRSAQRSTGSGGGVRVFRNGQASGMGN
jgi:pilus assembly protein CpaB